MKEKRKKTLQHDHDDHDDQNKDDRKKLAEQDEHDKMQYLAGVDGDKKEFQAGKPGHIFMVNSYQLFKNSEEELAALLEGNCPCWKTHIAAGKDPRGGKWPWVTNAEGKKLYTKSKVPMIKKLVEWAEHEKKGGNKNRRASTGG